MNLISPPRIALHFNARLPALSFMALALSCAQSPAQTLWAPGASVGNSGGANVGIGTSTPSSQLHVYQALADTSYAEQLNAEQLYSATATRTDYIKAIDIEKYKFGVPDGVVSNGYQIGLASQVFVADPYFAGTLANQFAIWARTGIYAAAGSGPRTIHNAYGIYLEGFHEVGTIVNHFGVFQSGAGTKNYFGGNVGIGTTSPRSRLDLGGHVGVGKGIQVGDYLEINERESINNASSIGWNASVAADDGTYAPAWAGPGGSGMVLAMSSGGIADLDFWGKNWNGNGAASSLGSFTHVMRLSTNGNVGIGTSAPTHKLSVNGTIKTKEVIVETTGWSDYVFAEDYALTPLVEIEAHIKEHKHLPGIPSAKEVAEQGVSIGEMQAKLLAKIEELTLHQIAQAREIEDLKRRNALLESRVGAETGSNAKATDLSP